MPLSAGSVVLSPPPPPPPVILPPRQLQGADVAHVVWIAPDGTEWPLTTPEVGWFTPPGPSGINAAAPVTMAVDPHPLGGGRVRHVQPQSRIMVWTLHIFGVNHTEFLTRWRALLRAFTMTRRRGPGTLVVYRPDGTGREIRAYYQDGFQDTPEGGWLHDDVAITLYAEDGFWRDRDPTVVTREYAVAGDYLNPFLTVSSSQVLGQTVIENPGEAEAWPDWTIHGPASLITAHSLTTGESWTLDPDAEDIDHGPLMAGEVVRLTTSPPTVRGPAGEVWTAALDWPGAVLWGLEPGANEVEFSVLGSGPGTAIELAFYARWESA